MMLTYVERQRAVGPGATADPRSRGLGPGAGFRGHPAPGVVTVLAVPMLAVKGSALLWRLQEPCPRRPER